MACTANHDKSHCFIGGMSDERKEEIMNILGVKEGSLPVEYLGFSLHSRKIKISEYYPFISKM